MFVRKHYAEVVKCPVCGEDESLDACYADVPAPVFKKATPPAPMVRLSPKNIRITLNTYTHVLPEMDINAAEKLDCIMLKKA